MQGGGFAKVKSDSTHSRVIRFSFSRKSHLKIERVVIRVMGKRDYWHLHLPMCHFWEKGRYQGNK